MRRILQRRSEQGFTLIELLVVMIIIGILAAVAIPIFMNQQKTSRDTATISDVKNMATLVHNAMVECPNANVFDITSNKATSAPTSVTLTKPDGSTVAPFTSTHTLTYDYWITRPQSALRVYNDASPSKSCFIENLSLSDGTVLHVTHLNSRPEGEFLVYGWNPKGKAYTGETVAMTSSTNEFPAAWKSSVLVYDSRSGGIKK